jgi:hypothetical protein
LAEIGFLQKAPQELAFQNKLVSWVLKHSKKSQGIYSFSIIEAANNLHLTIQEVNKELMRLKREDKEISCEWKDRGSCVLIRKCPEDLDTLCSSLYSKIVQLEDNKLSKLETIYSISNKFSYLKYEDIINTPSSEIKNKGN